MQKGKNVISITRYLHVLDYVIIFRVQKKQRKRETKTKRDGYGKPLRMLLFLCCFYILVGFVVVVGEQIYELRFLLFVV